MADPRATPPRSRRAGALPAFDRLAPPPPEADVRFWIGARSAPSDTVVELHGRGGWVTRAAAEDLRRGFDLETTSLTRLVAEIVLRPPDLRHLDAAFTALANAQRGGLSLRESIERGFTSRCASCGGPVIVEEFVWDGDAVAPSRRSYRCGHCRETRTGDSRAVPVDREDIAAAKAADGEPARNRLIGRFPVPDPLHELPDQLLDLYTPRALDAIAGTIERIESDMRAPGIEAALRLVLVGMLLPASKLNSFPGRVAQPRIVAGKLRPVGDRQWRERNPWLLLEDSFRLVRTFVQRLETGRQGTFHARFGPDLMALRDGTANVVVRQDATFSEPLPTTPSPLAPLPSPTPRPTTGTGAFDRVTGPFRAGPNSPAGPRGTTVQHGTGTHATGQHGTGTHATGQHGTSAHATGQHPTGAQLGVDPEGPLRSRVRLAMVQPPIHWSPENLAFAYLATALGLGMDATLSLPLDLVFEQASRTEQRSEWARDAVELRRSLDGVRPHLEADGTAVLLLDRQPSAAVVASVLGAVGAGFRMRDAAFTETGQEITGVVELTLPGGAEPVDRGIRDPAGPDGPSAPRLGKATGPFRRDELEAAIAELAVAVLQARGEPARYERLLGEVLLGLDRSGHLRRVTSLWTDLTRPAELVPAPVVPVTAELSDTTHANPDALGAATPIPPAPRRARSWRDPGRLVRGGDIEPVAPVVPPPPAEPPAPAPVTVPAHRADPVMESTEDASVPAVADPLAGADPVKITLDSIAAELHRADHPRLLEVEPGRWWLRDPRDIEAARPPLADRVEWAVFSLLSTSGGIPATAFDTRIASMFRGHDAPDEELVKACVDSYRFVVPDSDGLLQASGSLQDRYQEHGELVATIGALGHRLGLRIWIAPREQRRRVDGRPIAELLNEVEQRVYLPLVTPGPVEALEQVDCIWYLRGKATFLFEVEWTAMLGEPVLRRGAAIPAGDTVVRFLVIPAARTDLVRLKLARSPLLRERLEQDNWHIIKAEHLRRFVARDDPTLDDLAPLLGLDPPIERLGEQLPLFG